MATQTYGVNDPETVKLWSRLLHKEVDKSLDINALIGRSEDSAIMLHDQTQKQAGDRIRCTMVGQLRGLGVTEGETLIGKEESQPTYTDDIMINELWNAVPLTTEGSIDYQRVIHNLRSYARTQLRNWFSTRYSVAFFMHTAGYVGKQITIEGDTYSLTGSDKKKMLLHNDTTAATNVIRPGNKSDDESLTSSEPFTLQAIDEAVATAELANPKITPIMVNGEKTYVMYIHPNQVYQLRTNTGDGSWTDYSKRGPEHEDRIYKGAIGKYNNVILRKHEHVAPGYNSSTYAEISSVRRAVLVGAGAVGIAFGRNAGPSRYFWREDDDDFQREMKIGAGTICGMKKTQFNGKDWGCVVVPTYGERDFS